MNWKQSSTLVIVALILFSMPLINPLLAGYLTESAKDMAEKASPDEYLPAVIVMRDRPDIESLKKMVQGYPRKERTRIVREEMANFSEISQAGILDYLEDQQKAGLVEEFKSISFINVIKIQATKKVLETIAVRPDVDHVFDDPPKPAIDMPEPKPVNELDELAWSVELIGAQNAWDEGYTGEGILVAVIDSGVDYNHEDLEDHLWDGGEDYPNYGWDFGNGDNDPMDDMGHGTHCAGTVCGDGTGGIETGVAPDATLMCLKVSDWGGWVEEATVWEALDFCLEHEVDVTTMSLGFGNQENPNRSTWRETYDVLNIAGMVSIKSTGNSGHLQPPGSVTVPGDVPSPWRPPDEVEEGTRSGLMAVGATDENDNLTDFSSVGPCDWEDIEPYFDYPYGGGHEGLIKPDIAAPGEDVLSLDSFGGYVTMSGTSMAAPHIAGVVCLMLSKSDDLLPVQIDSILQISALDLGAEGKDNFYGGGRVQADSAVYYSYDPIGWVQGYVTDANDGLPVEDVILSIPGTQWGGETDSSGYFNFELFSGHRVLHAEKEPYDLYVNDTLVAEYGDTIDLNIELNVGLFSVYPESLSVYMDIAEDSVAEYQLTMFNTGTADMGVDLEVYPVIEMDSFLDEVFGFDASEPTGDTRLQGAIFVDDVFYVTGSNNHANPNMVYKFSDDGEFLASYEQPDSGADTDAVGIRDMAFDGNLIWGGDGRDIVAFDPEIGIEATSFEGPYNPNRAIAYHPDENLLYVADYMNEIIKIDPETGEEVGIIEVYERINGMGFWMDDPDGYILYVITRYDNHGGLIYKLNPADGDMIEVASIEIGENDISGFAICQDYKGYYTIATGIVVNQGNDIVKSWELSVDVPWINLSSESMTIVPSDSQVIDLSFLGEGLLSGFYRANILTYYNTLQPQTAIPIDLTIERFIDSVNDQKIEMPVEFSLDTPYPNPFNSTASIQFALPRDSDISLTIFDLLGREVVRLREGVFQAGRHSVQFEASKLSSGIYFVRMDAGGEFKGTKKIVLLK